MPKLYCQSCGGATSFDAVKPSFCSACGDPFVKKTVASITTSKTSSVAPTHSNTVMPHAKTLAERIVEMEAAQDDIPPSFDIVAEAEQIDVVAQSNDPNTIALVQRKLEKRYR
jgi:hypothetical protein